MSMLVGAALTGTAIPASAVEPNDPIFAAIEAHKAAHFRTTAAVDRQAVFERELVANGRLENRNRLEDERQQGAEIEAAIDEAWDDERDAACDLLSIHPSTMVGMIALP